MTRYAMNLNGNLMEPLTLIGNNVRRRTGCSEGRSAAWRTSASRKTMMFRQRPHSDWRHKAELPLVTRRSAADDLHILIVKRF